MGHLDKESTQALFCLTEVIPAPRNQVAFVLRQSKYNTFSYLSCTTMYMCFNSSLLKLSIVVYFCKYTSSCTYSRCWYVSTPERFDIWSKWSSRNCNLRVEWHKKSRTGKRVFFIHKTPTGLHLPQSERAAQKLELPMPFGRKIPVSTSRHAHAHFKNTIASRPFLCSYSSLST